MRIGGYQPLTLSDFPGSIAAIVFTQGCSFRCPFCHNGALLPYDGEEAFDTKEVLYRLWKRRQHLDGVVITGGEPTIHEDLTMFIFDIKSIGLKVKLDTNGTRPDVIEKLLSEGLLDYIAMDIKAPLEKYNALAGVDVDIDAIARSIEIIGKSGIDHEFRTTVVPALLSDEDVAAIQKLVPEGSTYKLQDFDPTNALNPELRTTQNEPIGV
ncbi:MAG: anaerobic ribonucleoside-triphosphate reductase activating protein [Waddliaceae bacterium]|jgi:pyruvate formate lyase activating enzyme|nr:anaerobic ribonucleoside-triphosphate reductase activating protein [Waddliaceae bacterium]MBT3578476.1 anaerobic ribonucleoside-triphosphate reductase activating protein [Waddliaceae bacterium]MBT4444944.1 anaerobic ribonucleoside-triphosphate reductase activating protein [Waddliaceae bacterium]MBT6927988.1 anaerobic ribonucleoside-triphosphate reductase activating protein [Waddliaceae bacterium]MBT7263896.1 anaerobic ribonucleoside-triphosphate reductase activating protein [Waddliaceae bact